MNPCWHVVWKRDGKQRKVDCHTGDTIVENRVELDNPVCYTGPHGIFLTNPEFRYLDCGWDRSRSFANRNERD